MVLYALFSPCLLALSHRVSAAPYSYSSLKSPVRTTYQFPNETWVENIAVRSSGQLLVTIITSPDLYQVDLFSSAPASLVHSFPHAQSTLGITEV